MEINQVLIDLLISEYDIASLRKLYISSNKSRSEINSKLVILSKHLGLTTIPKTLPELIDYYVEITMKSLPFNGALKVAVEWDSTNNIIKLLNYNFIFKTI